MSEFCSFITDGLGTKCERCGCWRRGDEPPPCPSYITRFEPDGSRLPHIKTHAENALAMELYFDERDAALAQRQGK
jgi:hypothetical protein